MIGAKVSHQQVPKKKLVPNTQPKTNDFAVDSLSRSIAQKRGIRANHARNQNSKSGNARINRNADTTAKRIFFQSGSSRAGLRNFIATVYQNFGEPGLETRT